MGQQARILIIEPYYGGSHSCFLQGLMSSIDAEFILMTLPARKWKMRMQLSALWFVQEIKKLPETKREFDAVLCSTFVDLAVLKSLLVGVKGFDISTRFCVYYHENQFAYPGRIKDKSIHQFTSINFTSGLAADGLAFNSHYNRDSFFKASRRYLKKAADMELLDYHTWLREKSIVLHPGMSYAHIDGSETGQPGNVPVVVWNHRWEHDKNPELFFATMESLHQKGVKFKLIVLGQAFGDRPTCFEKAKHVLKDSIIHWGYLEQKEQYGAMLKKGDFVISCALHEFFGISVLEAVRAGCRPLLPSRLSYPELFPKEFLYEDIAFEDTLETLLTGGSRLDEDTAKKLTEPYQWRIVAKDYSRWVLGE